MCPIRGTAGAFEAATPTSGTPSRQDIGDGRFSTKQEAGTGPRETFYAGCQRRIAILSKGILNDESN